MAKRKTARSVGEGAISPAELAAEMGMPVFVPGKGLVDSGKASPEEVTAEEEVKDDDDRS